MTRPHDSTAMMQQYERFRRQHPGCILFIRCGDFYETFHDHAWIVHEVAGVTLTEYDRDIAQAGVPFYRIETVLRTLFAAGYRCAIADYASGTSEQRQPTA